MLRRRRTKARRAYATEAAALQSALDVLIGELRVGAHPVAAIDVAAREVDGPVAESLRGVAARARLGADVAAGIRSIAASSRLSAHWERLALFWGLAQTHGLAIATLMRAAHRDLVERERFSARVDAGMAGARTTAAVLAGLPVLGIGLGEAHRCRPAGFPAVRRCRWLAAGCRCDARLLRAAVVGSHHESGADMSLPALLLAAALLSPAVRRGFGYVRSPRGQRRLLRCRATRMRSLSRPPSTCSRPASPQAWRCRRRPQRRLHRRRAGLPQSSTVLRTCWRLARIPLRHGPIPTSRSTATAMLCSGWLGGRRCRVPPWPRGLPIWPISHATTRRSAADARAQRASVLIAGPLGLCYLPAFVCLGIVPIVAGLAGDVLRSGLA